MLVEEKTIYINHLINRIFKILPLSESNNNTIPYLYLKRLIDDVSSANLLFNGILINIKVKLNILCTETLNHEEIKSIVFDCTNLCKKIANRLKEGDFNGL